MQNKCRHIFLFEFSFYWTLHGVKWTFLPYGGFPSLIMKKKGKALQLLESNWSVEVFQLKNINHTELFCFSDFLHNGFGSTRTSHNRQAGRNATCSSRPWRHTVKFSLHDTRWVNVWWIIWWPFFTRIDSFWRYRSSYCTKLVWLLSFLTRSVFQWFWFLFEVTNSFTPNNPKHHKRIGKSLPVQRDVKFLYL